MKTEITRPTWEDVVFESRNKEYGAYSIRKSYDENISKASLIALLFAAFVFACLQIASLMHIKIKIPVPISDPSGLINPPIIIPNPPDKPAAVQMEQKVNHNLLEKVVTHDVETAPVKSVEVTLPGAKSETNTGLPAEAVLGKGDEVIPVVIDPPKVWDIAEVMPQYEGGTQAMIRFISKNIHYPASARAMGQEGTVYVRFVVNDLGRITDVEVIRGVSAILDREAMHVIAAMSKWKPGLQHNLPVNVRMVLPIKFQLEQ